MIMSQLHSKQQKRVENVKAEVITTNRSPPNNVPRPQMTADVQIKKPRAKHRMVNAYGSSGKASKTRRCGE